MRSRRALSFVWIGMILAIPALPQAPGPPPNQPVVAQVPTACLQTISPSVFATLRDLDTRYQETNSAFVVTEGGIIAVDPPGDRPTFDCALRSLRDRTQAPIVYVVYTHWHGDHTGGAGYLDGAGEEGGAVIVASPAVDAESLAEARRDHEERLAYYREQLPLQSEILESGTTSSGREITAEEREMLEEWIPSRMRWLETHQEVRFLAPQIRIEGQMRLDLEPEVRLIELSGHTDGDLVVYVPSEGVLIAGDLVDRIPFAGHGSLSRWEAALDRLAELAPRRIVPGHGPLYEGPEQLGRLLAYFARVRQLASQQQPAPSADDEARAETAERMFARYEDELAALLLPDAAPNEIETFRQMAGSVLEAALAEGS